MFRRLSRLWRSGGHTPEADPSSDLRTPDASTRPGAPPAPSPARDSPPDYRGFHEGATGEWISGWAWDSTRPDTPIDVDIYDGDTLLARVTANTFRQDLLNAGRGDGRHAFVYTLPASLKDGRTHTIRVKVSGTDVNLKNTPKEITYRSVAAIYQGAHGRSDCMGIYGWAWDSMRPDKPVNVDIYDGDTLLATVTADQFHQSLLDAGKGNGKHIFFYALPARLKDGQPHIMRVKIAGTSIELKNTPKTIICPLE